MVTTGATTGDVGGLHPGRPGPARRPGSALECSASRCASTRGPSRRPAGDDGQQVGAERCRCGPAPPRRSRCRPRSAGSPRRRRSGCRAWSAPSAACWPQAAQGEPEDLADAHQRASRRGRSRGRAASGRGPSGGRSSAAAVAGLVRRRRSGRRPAGSTRLACSATSSSWVIRTMVRPAALSRSNRPITSCGRVAVQVAGGLVGQQQRGRGDQRPGHGDPLLLAAGELVGQVVDPVGQARPARARPAPGARRSAAAPRRRPAAVRRSRARWCAAAG